MARPSPWWVNNSPYLPRSLRAIWRNWSGEGELTFTSAADFATEVAPAVGAELAAKREFILATGAAARGLVSGFFLPETALNLESDYALATDRPDALGEARILIANPSHPRWTELQSAIRARAKSYAALSEFTSDAVGKVEVSVDWAFDLLAWGNRPWLNATAPCRALWLEQVNQLLTLGKLTVEELEMDRAEGLWCPSLTLRENKLTEVDSLHAIDGESLNPEIVSSAERRAYLASGELRRRVLWHSRRVRFLEIQKKFAARPGRRLLAQGRALLSEMYRGFLRKAAV